MESSDLIEVREQVWEIFEALRLENLRLEQSGEVKDSRKTTLGEIQFKASDLIDRIDCR